jgi:hypothetical protein
MAMLLIPAIFLFAISMALLCLGIMGVVLMIVLRILTGILWVAVKILEHRNVESEILSTVEDDELPMRDVTPRLKAINGPRAARGN